MRLLVLLPLLDHELMHCLHRSCVRRQECLIHVLEPAPIAHDLSANSTAHVKPSGLRRLDTRLAIVFEKGQDWGHHRSKLASVSSVCGYSSTPTGALVKSPTRFCPSHHVHSVYRHFGVPGFKHPQLSFCLYKITVSKRKPYIMFPR